MNRTASVGLLVVLTNFLTGTGSTPLRSFSALAPVEEVADEFQRPVGVAVDEAGAVFVSDRKAGTISRILPDGKKTVILTGLKRPGGLALGSDGRLHIAEEGGGRLLRLEPSGALAVLASHVLTPRWPAIAPDGTLYLSAKGWHRADGETRGAQRGEIILRLGNDGTLTRFAEGFAGVQGIAVRGQILYAVAERLPGEAKRPESTLVRLPIEPDGRAGPPEVLVRINVQGLAGVAVDRLGAVFFAAKLRKQGVILKRLPGGRLVAFASGLKAPRGMAFEPEGHLLVAEDEAHPGRLLRFRAPPPPTVIAPGVTNQSPVSVTGQAEPGSLLSAFRVDDFDTEITSTAAGVTAGFTLAIPLLSNFANALAITATGARGFGLTGPAAELSVLHDGQSPGVTILYPPAGAFARGTVTLEARTGDEGSGVTTLSFTLDGRTLGTVANPDPTRSFLTRLPLDTTTLADGTHTLGVTAIDRAGNSASTSQALLVDNAPPDTQITGGPSGETPATTVTFTFTGTDNLTPVANLVFAGRLDGGPFTAFSSATTATFTGLAEGSHTFEVRARDRAGNEDPTPAQRSFTVSGLRVTITEPSDGATVTPGLLLVRGTVEAGGVEVGVVINGIPAAVQGAAFSAIVPVTVETGSLTAVATTVKGPTATHTIAVSVAPPAAVPVALHASPSSGEAPLTVLFSLAGASLPAQVSLDADGDGLTDFSGARLEQQPFIFTQPGTYVSTATMTDAQGSRQTTRAIIQVFDRNVLDGLLQAKWVSLKDSLRRGDIPQALEQIVARSRRRYSEIFTTLAQDLQDVDRILTDLFLVEMRGPEVIYEMVRADDGITRSFEIRFLRDEDGIWRLWIF